jgi:uncharacterized protein involved in type VI secretion and phage assembly
MTVAQYRFELKIDNQVVPQGLLDSLAEVVVDTSLYLPDMFGLYLYDDKLTWVDSASLNVGKPIEITAVARVAGEGIRENQRFPLVKGEITSLEVDFAPEGRPLLTVRGYDRTHRLHRGKHSRSFQTTTDSAIVQKIAQELKLGDEAALKETIDPTDTQYDYVFQDNLTNLEFLFKRAQRIGYQLYVEDNVLHFKREAQDKGEGPLLTWRDNLRSFHPVLSTAHQVSQVEVRSWDTQRKETIIGLAEATEVKLGPVINGKTQSGGAAAESAFFPTNGNQAKTVIVDRPVTSVEEANLMAQAINNQLNSDYIQAEGVCFGDPRIRAGKTVTVANVSSRFNGTYFVNATTHVYRVDGYETIFKISGRNQMTLSDLLDPAENHSQRWGLVTGLVTNINDPLSQGRLKVKFPWLTDDPKGQESTWARLATSIAGNGRGFLALPRVNDEVLVGFEHGDIHRPYILGTLWNGVDKPPGGEQVIGQDGQPKQWLFTSYTGQAIVLDDATQQIIIRDKEGKNQIVISSAKQKTSLEIKTAGRLEITTKDVQIKADEDSLSILAERNLTLEAKGNVTIKGKRIDLNPVN